MRQLPLTGKFMGLSELGQFWGAELKIVGKQIMGSFQFQFSLIR